MFGMLVLEVIVDASDNDEPDRRLVHAEPERSDAMTTLGYLSGLTVAPVVRALVIFFAVPAGTPWRRSCGACGEPLRYPWLSVAFAPTGRCPRCRCRLGAPPYLVEIAVLLAVAALVAGHRLGWETLAFGWWLTMALALALVDTAVHRLPDRLTLTAAAGTIALLAIPALVEHDAWTWLRALSAGVGALAVFGLITLLLGRRGGYGLGDAKLMLSAGMVLGWVGWPAVFTGLLLAWTAQGMFAVALLVTRRASRSAHLAFGPFVLGGTLASLVLLR